MSSEPKILPSIRIDNISTQHQTDLINKLKLALHPLFENKSVQKLINDEIEKRIQNREWDMNI